MAFSRFLTLPVSDELVAPPPPPASARFQHTNITSNTHKVQLPFCNLQPHTTLLCQCGIDHAVYLAATEQQGHHTAYFC